MKKQSKIAIAIDKWKLDIFIRHLRGAGYTFSCVDWKMSESVDTLLLHVDTVNVDALAVVVQAANAEVARTGRPSS